MGPDVKETTRVEAFSDGVFAIAITLLVLDLRVPHAGGSVNLSVILTDQWPSFVAFFNSFLTILIIWMNHHNLFNHIVRTNNVFMLWNGMLLLCNTFLPFPTSLVAEYYGHSGEIIATAIYTGTFFLMSISFNGVWRYASANHRLLSHSVTDEQVASINRQYVVGPAFYGLSFLLSFVNVTAALVLTIAIAIFYAVTASTTRKGP